MKWLDSWLSEHHISASFPQLVTEYWLNKPINDTDYQTFSETSSRNATLVTNTSSVASNQIDNTAEQHILAHSLANDANIAVLDSIAKQNKSLLQEETTTDVVDKQVNDTNNTDTVTLDLGNLGTVDDGQNVPHLFSEDEKVAAVVANALAQHDKDIQQQQQQQQHQQTESQNNDNQDLLHKENSDFPVVEDLRLPNRVDGMKEIQRISGRPFVNLLAKQPPESVFLIGKTSPTMYTIATGLKDKTNKVNPEYQKAPPASVFNQLQHFNNQQQQKQHNSQQTLQQQQHQQAQLQQQHHQQGIPLTIMQHLGNANNSDPQQLQHQDISLEIVRGGMGTDNKRSRVELQGVLEKKPPGRRASSKKDPKDKQPVACDICGKMISSRKNLRVHKTVRHFKNGSFSCDICGRKFALNRDLQRHMPLHTNERNYVCKFCGLQCKQPGHLTKHLRTHTEVMNWRCDCCFKNFKVQAELKEHCFTEHADIKDKNLTCSVCKEKLKVPNSVYLHSLRHSGVREHECPQCKATFKMKQHLQVILC